MVVANIGPKVFPAKRPQFRNPREVPPPPSLANAEMTSGMTAAIMPVCSTRINVKLHFLLTHHSGTSKYNAYQRNFFHRTNTRRNKMPVQPTEKEEEYFALREFERLKKLEQEKQQKLAASEKERLKKLHYMQCPKCGMHLVEIDYRGIKIDRCSDCEGILLDKGELVALTNLGENVLGKLFSVFRK